MNLRRERALVWWGAALPLWVLLLFLLSPTVTRGGDCGELIAASYTLGIAHPSGYPVWCLLGRIFALLPLGEIAWRYNLFSSVCGMAAVGTIAMCVHRLVMAQFKEGDAHVNSIVARWSSLGAGWLLGGFFYVGTQFLIAEVYALAALMGALLLYFALAWYQDGNYRDAYTLAILAGLVPVVHLSGVFFLPFLLFLAVWKRGLKASQFATAGAFFACALLPILYLPIRSAPFPAPPPTSIDSSYYWPLDWSHPSTLSGLKQHVTAAQYRRLLVETDTVIVDGKAVTVKRMAQPVSQIPGRLRELGTFVLLGYLWATPLLLVGLWRSFADKRIGWVLLLIFGANLSTQINYKVSDQSNFFFPCYLVMALWMGLGWSAFLGALWRREGLARAAAPLLVLATVAVQWSLFAPPASQASVLRIRDAALQQARAAQNQARQSGKPATILFYTDDGLWAFWYAKFVLGAAPDVATPYGRLVFQRALDKDAHRYVEALGRDGGPVFLTHWDAPTDARHPLQMATPAGNLLLVTNRKLPLPAQPLGATDSLKATPGPNGLERARFRRAAVWKAGESSSAPNISIGSMAAFDVDFRAPQPLANAPVSDAVRGEIEVLIAPVGTFGKRAPAPDENAREAQGFNVDRVLVTRQTRRLVLPADARAGELYRFSVPLYLNADSVVGRYQVWTRLVSDASDQVTPWTPTDEVFLTQR